MSERFCSNCGNKVSKEERFCNQCGQKLDFNEEEAGGTAGKTKKESPKPDGLSAAISGIAEHLEFLGYSVEYLKKKTPGDTQLVTAKNERLYNLVFWELPNHFVLIQAYINIKKMSDAPTMDAATESANRNMIFFKAYYVTENSAITVRLQVIYTGEYQKTVFGQFHDILERDEATFNSDPLVQKAFN